MKMAKIENQHVDEFVVIVVLASDWSVPCNLKPDWQYGKIPAFYDGKIF